MTFFKKTIWFHIYNGLGVKFSFIHSIGDRLPLYKQVSARYSIPYKENIKKNIVLYFDYFRFKLESMSV